MQHDLSHSLGAARCFFNCFWRKAKGLGVGLVRQEPSNKEKPRCSGHGRTVAHGTTMALGKKLNNKLSFQPRRRLDEGKEASLSDISLCLSRLIPVRTFRANRATLEPF